MWENLASLLNILTDSARHFLFSGFAGLLVYFLIWITYFALTRLFKRAGWLRSTAVSLVIHTFSVVLCLLAAFGLHALLDTFVSWYNTPLAPPMTIIK